MVDTNSPLIDVVTGGLRDEYHHEDGNGLHLNPVGRRVFAETLADGLAEFLPPAPLVTAKTEADPFSLNPRGLYLTPSGNWGSFGDTTKLIVSQETPPDGVAGKVQKMVYSGTANAYRQSSTTDGHAVMPAGTRLAFTGRVKITGLEQAAALGGDPKVMIRADVRMAAATVQFIVGIYDWRVDTNGFGRFTPKVC